MDRRRFIELLARTAAISTVAYSFPSIIKPLNIAGPERFYFSHSLVNVPWLLYLPSDAVEYVVLPRFTKYVVGDGKIIAPDGTLPPMGTRGQF